MEIQRTPRFQPRLPFRFAQLFFAHRFGSTLWASEAGDDPGFQRAGRAHRGRGPGRPLAAVGPRPLRLGAQLKS